MYRIFKNFGLCLFVLVGLSCISNKSSQLNFRVEPFVDSPRIFYGETGNPTKSEHQAGTCERLSQEELNRIQALVAQRTQKSIWFVRVPLSSSQRYRGQLWVYLAPDVANSRYRSGVAYTIGMLSSSKGLYVSEPWRYVQVSFPDKVFDNVLETPEVSELPFQYPSQNRRGSENKQEILTQEELINILDYVRNPELYLKFDKYKVISREKSSGGGTMARISASFPPPDKMAETVVSQPLVSINKDVDELRVAFGFVHNGLFARCVTVTLKKTEQGYEIIQWNSIIA